MATKDETCDASSAQQKNGKAKNQCSLALRYIFAYGKNTQDERKIY